MRLGHRRDEWTLSLYRLDEVSTAAGAQDETGLATCTQSGNPALASGRIGGGRVGSQAGSTVIGFNAGNDTVRAAFRTGEWTIEAWVNPSAAPTSTFGYVYSCGTSSTAGNTAAQLGCLGITQTLQVFTQWAGFGAAFNSGAFVVPLGQWSHIASRVTITGATRTADLFINGVLVATATARTAPSAGDTATIRVGYLTTGAFHFIGTLDDVRVSSVARKDAEILESYQRGAGIVLERLGHKLDGSTLGLWRMDEASGDLSDAVGVSHLTRSGAIVSGVAQIGMGITIGDASSRAFRTLSTMPGFYAAHVGGSITWEWWMNLNGVAPGATSSVLIFGSNVFYVQISTARTLRAYLGGSSPTPTSSAAGAMPLTGWTHLAMRATYATATTRLVQWFVNGVASGSPLEVTPAFGTTGASFSIGASTIGLPASYDDMRISAVARTDAEILESYERGVGRGHPKLGHLLDGDTFAAWRCDEVGGDLMDAVSVRHLVAGNAPGVVAGQIGGGRSLLATSLQDFSRATEPGIRDVFRVGAATFECWVNLQGAVSYSGTQDLFNHAAVNGAYGTTNSNLFRAVIFTDRTFGIAYTGVVGPAASTNLRSAADATGLVPSTGWHHLAFRMAIEADTTRTLAVFLNGAKAAELTGQVAPSGGASGNLKFGRYQTAYCTLAFDDARLSNMARTDAEILESFQRGAGLLPATVLPRVERRGRLSRRAG